MPELRIEVSDRDLAEQLFNQHHELSDIVEFVSTLVDYVEGYGYDFRDMVIKRLEADK